MRVTITDVDIAMELVEVRIEPPDNTPVVFLREQAGRQRGLAIMIGNAEASSIHFALKGLSAPRPMTHDLLVQFLTLLDATVDRVVITEIREHTYYATIHLQTAAGLRELSSRPSDAMAIAARTGAPIYATSELLDEVGQEPEVEHAELGEGEAESILDEFRDFIENISPEDFSS